MRIPRCRGALTRIIPLALSISLALLAPTGGGLAEAPDLPDGPIFPTPPVSIPARQPGALSGTEFGNLTKGMAGRERQRLAVNELLAGNVPEYLRSLRPVHLTARSMDGASVLTATVWVMPDYLAIGSDRDFLRIPLTRPSIALVSKAFDLTLPTKKIVDAVFEQADYRYSPQPLPPGPKMRSSAYYLRHQELIEGQHESGDPNSLVVGCKKDIVLTGRLRQRSDRIAIYGWHRRSGDPIQPLSLIHGARYADYSHGVRLMSPNVEIGGSVRSIYEVLADPLLAPILSDEGPIPQARQLVSSSG